MNELTWRTSTNENIRRVSKNIDDNSEVTTVTDVMGETLDLLHRRLEFTYPKFLFGLMQKDAP